MRKFITRHRLGVAITAGVVVLLTAMTAFYTIRLSDALGRARTEAAKAEEVNQFLQSMLASVDPMRGDAAVAPESLTVATLLRTASENVGAEMAAQPAVRAAIHRTLGLTFQNLGLYTEAEPHLRAALALRTALHPDDLDPERLQSLDELAAFAYIIEDPVWFDSLQNEVVALYRARYGNQSREYADALASRASTLPLAQADPMYQEALAIIEANQGPRSLDAFTVLAAFATRRMTLGDWAGADSLFARAVALGPDVGLDGHPTLAIAMTSWSSNLFYLGNYARAESLLVRSLAIQEARLPDDHPRLAETRSNYAGILVEQSRYREAERLLRHTKSVFETQQPLWWARHAAGSELGAAVLGQGRYAEGEALMREHLAGMRAGAGDDHGWTRHFARHLVAFYDAQGRTADADSLRPLVGY